MQRTRFWPARSLAQSSVLPDAFRHTEYHYMSFPSDQVSKIPDNPANVLRWAWENRDRKPFMDWLQTGLASVDYDIGDLKLHAMVHYKALGLLVSHENPPQHHGSCAEKYKTVGKIAIEAVYQSGRVPDPDAIRRANQIVMDYKHSADDLLETLFECTVALYGTETPFPAWPALLRAAARGWALIMIKAQLGSFQKQVDFGEKPEDDNADYLFQFVFMGEEFKLDDHARCPARITNILVRIIIDAKVPLFENEEDLIMRLNQTNMAHLGLPAYRDGQSLLSERRAHWKTETDFLVKHLFPLDYCVRLMFGPIFHMKQGISEEPSRNTLDFQVLGLEEKARLEAELLANEQSPLWADGE